MERIGPYEIRGELGRGAMGVVYRAYREDLKREFALKVILAGSDASPEAVARFQREAQSAAQLSNHPGIVGVHDIGEADGKVYFAMDLVEGRALDDVLDLGETDQRTLVGYIAQAAHAVEHAHAQGILHRDLKPANIMITPDGNALVADFGLAKVTESDPEATRLTRTGQVMGTPAYMPPEQANGDTLDARSDVYALGATLYEALCGTPPFQGDSLHALLLRVMRDDPKPPIARDPRIPRPLNTIALKCLEKFPARRYRSADALAQDLERWSRGEAIVAKPPTRGERAARWLNRHKALVATAVVVAIVATVTVGLLVVPYWQQARADAAEAKQAEMEKTAALARKAAAQPHLDRGRDHLNRLDRLRGMKDWTDEQAKELWTGAAECFSAALEADPESVQACLGQARTARAAGDGRTALNWLNRAVARDGGYAPARLARAIHHLEQSAAHSVGGRVGQALTNPKQQAALDAAITDLEALGGADATEEVRRLAKAFLLYANGEYVQAGQEFLTVATAKVADPVPLTFAGLAFMHGGRAGRSKRAFDRVVAMLPRDAKLRAYRGYAGMAAGDAKAAITDFDRALELDPMMHAARANRGAARLTSGDYRGALNDLNIVLRLSPNDALVLGNRGSAKWRLGDLDGALADYDAALKCEPGFTGIYRSRAPLYMARRNYAAAHADYDELVQAFPKDTQWLHKRAMAGARAGLHAEAIADCTEVLRREPNWLAALRLRAHTKQRSDDLPGAVADFTALLTRTPANSEFYAPVKAELAEARRLLAAKKD